MYTPIVLMHDELNVNMLYQWRCQHIVIQLYKFIHGQGPESCQNLFKFVYDSHNVNTRAADSLLLYVSQTRRVTDNDLAVSGPKLWNQLPGRIRAIESLELFKTEIKNFTFLWHRHWCIHIDMWEQSIHDLQTATLLHNGFSFSLHLCICTSRVLGKWRMCLSRL